MVPAAGKAWGRAVLVALAVSVAASAWRIRPALAKEHGSGCGALPAVVERVRNTLLLASVHRTRGSSLAAYQVLRINADSLVHDPAVRPCGALGQFLEVALRRAAGSDTAAAASSELDLGFTAALALAVAGRAPPDTIAAKKVDVPESAQYGENCPDFLAIVRRLETPGAPLGERVAAVLRDLQAHPRCEDVRRLLDAPADLLAPAVDALVLDEAQQSPSADNPIARCPELPLVLDRLTAAVRTGVPLFNKGDHEGCRRVYAAAARALSDQVIPPHRCPVIRQTLSIAMAESGAAATADEAAWALRRGFDRIAGSVQPP
jgi:hypothetical protein